MKDILVLLSGGIDSFACANFLNNKNFKIKCLFIDYDQISSKLEKESAIKISKFLNCELNIIEIKNNNKKISDGEIQGRNAFLIYSALLFGIKDEGLISIGIHSGTKYFDCSQLFFERINRDINETTNGKIGLVAPFLEWEKPQIIEYFLDSKLPIEITYSCERGIKEGCGDCLSCKDRDFIYASI